MRLKRALEGVKGQSRNIALALVVVVSAYFAFGKAIIADYHTTETDRAKTCSEIAVLGTHANSAASALPIGYGYGWEYESVIGDLKSVASGNMEGRGVLGTVYIPGNRFWNAPACILRTVGTPDGKWVMEDRAHDLMDISVERRHSSSLPLLDLVRETVNDGREKAEKASLERDAELRKTSELVRKYEEAKKTGNISQS